MESIVNDKENINSNMRRNPQQRKIIYRNLLSKIEGIGMFKMFIL